MRITRRKSIYPARDPPPPLSLSLPPSLPPLALYLSFSLSQNKRRKNNRRAIFEHTSFRISGRRWREGEQRVTRKTSHRFFQPSSLVASADIKYTRMVDVDIPSEV